MVDTKFKPYGEKRNDTFTSIIKATLPTELKKGSTDARNWYRTKAQEVIKINEKGLMITMDNRYVQMVQPGRMYMFYYDPKHKATLPYYDRFPMIFPISMEKDSFLGLNLHYLPLAYRAQLMDALHDISNNAKYDHTTKLKISYGLLKSASKYKYFRPTIKRYLKSHVRSRFVEIYAHEWDLALWLPLARFEKASPTKVWADSKKIINAL